MTIKFPHNRHGLYGSTIKSTIEYTTFMQKLCCEGECGEITINYAKWENQGLSMIWTSAPHYVPAMSCITLQTAPLVHVQKQSCCHTTPQKTKNVFNFQAICIQHISIFKCLIQNKPLHSPLNLVPHIKSRQWQARML